MTYRSHGGAQSRGLSGMLKNNPEGLLLLAAGAALLMRSGSKHSSSRTRWSDQRAREWDERESEVESEEHERWVPDQVAKAATNAKKYATGVGDTVAETVSSVGSRAREYTADAGRTISRQSQRLAGQATSTFRQTVDRVLDEQPLAVVIAGLAAGAAVAAAFPSTRMERETLGPAREKVSALADAATERLGEAASAASERLADVAEDKGITSDGLRDAARDVADAFEKKLTGGEEPGRSTDEPRAGTRSTPRGSQGPTR
jgi:hypothetical protein